VKQSLVAATCISSAISCFLMAFLANMPLAVAPGMGINAYFTYQVGGGVCCVCQGGGGWRGVVCHIASWSKVS
jgi:AGZA family xanthine/uracil permease-like MFS transporter